MYIFKINPIRHSRSRALVDFDIIELVGEDLQMYFFS